MITSTKEYSFRPTEITLEVKNPEDSNWIQVTRVANMIWWKNGLAKVIYVDLKKPYYQYRFRNINTSIANNTEWCIQSLDLIQSSLTSQYLCLDYPPLSFLFNDYPDTVLFPLSPLYSNFVLETELPPGMWIDGRHWCHWRKTSNSSVRLHLSNSESPFIRRYPCRSYNFYYGL